MAHGRRDDDSRPIAGTHCPADPVVVRRLRWLGGDRPAAITTRWPLSAAEVLGAFRTALRDDVLAATSPASGLVYRLQGGVTGRTVSVRVSLSATHVGPWPYLLVTGEVVDVAAGSVFKGRMTQPGAASPTWALVLVALAIIGVLLPLSGLGPLAIVVWLVGVVTIVAGPRSRHRSLLRHAANVASILESIPYPSEASRPA
jgi:hypothetical protein